MDIEPPGFCPHREQDQREINNQGTGVAAVRCHHLEEEKFHVWTRIYKNPSCLHTAHDGVLESGHALGLQGERVVICGVGRFLCEHIHHG